MTFLNETAAIDDRSAPGDVYRAFDNHREELTWLASFLMADRELADVCLLDAYEQSIRHNVIFKESPERWARRAIIHSALEIQQSRLSTLWPIYLRRGCPHEHHASLAPELLKLLTSQAPRALLRLDVLCRFALALRGSEDYSASESAMILGISRDAFDAAYCAALNTLNQFAAEILEMCDEAEPEG